jgi:hypothetical protein
MKRGIVLLLLAGLLAGCSATTQSAPSTMSDQEAFALARKRVTESLKDPSSAQFGSQFFRKTHSAVGLPWDRVCGTVNGKNSFGAYTGMQIFVYHVADDVVRIGDRASVICKLDMP